MREKTVEIGCINIVMQPHGHDSYIKLFKHVEKLDSVQIGDHDFVRIRHFKEYESGVYSGKLIKHLRIDDNWLDSRTNLRADPEDVVGIIPEHLLPGLIEFDFVFFNNGHRLFYTIKNNDSRSASPNRMNKMVAAILNVGVKSFGKDVKIYTHVETSHSGISELFNLSSIHMIEYDMTIPNPDDLSHLQKKIKTQLSRQNVKRKVTKLVSDKGESIEADASTKAEMILASSNGFASTSGYNEKGILTVKSTKDHPLIDRTKYNPRKSTLFQALATRSASLLKEIISRI